MRVIGFSTGALAYGNFRLGLEILTDSHIKAIELSALRENELSPLIHAMNSLDLGSFTYISVHAPSKYGAAREEEVIKLLRHVAQRNWPIILHPDAIHSFSAWREFASLVFIENMDKRNLTGRTVRELTEIFAKLPEARLCLDLGHSRQVDPTMNESYLILQQFGSRLGQLHLSEVNSSSTHDPLSDAAVNAFEKIAALVPEDVPVILESPVPADGVQAEVQRARLALATTKPTNGNSKRESRKFQTAFI